MRNLLLLLIGSIAFVNCNAQADKLHLGPQEFYDSIQANAKIVLLNVRTPAEYSKGFIGNAVNIDFNDEDFSSRISNLDKNTKYYVYCLAGSRSSAAIKQMQGNGISNISELKGGMMAWKKEGLPVVEMESVPDKISRDSYEKIISGELVLVDFYAPWCGPCRRMEPSLEALQKKFQENFILSRINIDENKNLATDLGVMEIPVLKLFRDGKEVWEHRGYAEKDVIEKAVADQLK